MPPFDGTSATASFLSFSLHQLGGGGRHNNNHSSDDTSVTSHNSRSSAHTTKPELEDNTDDPRAEKALRSVQGALTAIVDVFEHEGVASASIQELRDGIENGRFINVLERAKDYASYITPSSSQSIKPSDENSICQTVMMACLLHAAWDACMRYYQMQYQTAYRRFHKLRRKHHHQQHKQERHPELAVPMIPVEVVDRALEIQVQRAEQVCTCQREVILAGALEKRLTRARQATTTSRSSAVAAAAST